MKKLLWLDDTRSPIGFIDNDPDKGSWLVFSPIPQPFRVDWIKNYKDFVFYIEHNGLPDGICFDHDLGMDVAIKARSKGMSKRESRKLKQQEMTGMDCARWLVDYCIDRDLDLPLYNIQSANPVGKENIDKLLKNYIKYRS